MTSWNAPMHSNSWRKTERCQRKTSWTWKHTDLDRICSKFSQTTVWPGLMNGMQVLVRLNILPRPTAMEVGWSENWLANANALCKSSCRSLGVCQGANREGGCLALILIQTVAILDFFSSSYMSDSWIWAPSNTFVKKKSKAMNCITR